MNKLLGALVLAAAFATPAHAYTTPCVSLGEAIALFPEQRVALLSALDDGAEIRAYRLIPSERVIVIRYVPGAACVTVQVLTNVRLGG